MISSSFFHTRANCLGGFFLPLLIFLITYGLPGNALADPAETSAEAKIEEYKTARDVLAGISVGSLAWGIAIFAVPMAGAASAEGDGDLAFGIYAIVAGSTAAGVSFISGITALALRLKVMSLERGVTRKGEAPPSEVLKLYDRPWIDQPGNRLFLAGGLIAGISLVPLVLGAIFMFGDARREWAGFALLPIGWAMGIAACGLFAGGFSHERRARVRAAAKISPYIAPWVSRKEAMADNAGPDGLVVGISGSF